MYVDNPVYYEGTNTLLKSFLCSINDINGHITLDYLISAIHNIVCINYCCDIYKIKLQYNRVIKSSSSYPLKTDDKKYKYDLIYFKTHCKYLLKMMKKYVEKNNINIQDIDNEFPIIKILDIYNENIEDQKFNINYDVITSIVENMQDAYIHYVLNCISNIKKYKDEIFIKYNDISSNIMEMFAIILNNTVLQISNIISILNKSYSQFAQAILNNCADELQDEIDNSNCIISKHAQRQSKLKTVLIEFTDICFKEFC